MKRDMELIRRLLLETETLSYDGGMRSRKFGGSWFNDVEDDAFYYHVKLLSEAKYIISISPPHGDNSVPYFPYSLTWEGHELLDSIRSDSTWDKVKNSFGKALSTIPVTVLASVTAEMTKEWALKKVGLKP
ncbi:hypothetical protein PAALTS15_05828 [Paenibacillus alvei TS-15]|uniref:DUF2513 domain-containing protein n=1 Tax=Paenibacillus alvei TS-15 TaxID=1117108 RepID=S9U143_PAEAL|nr:DUF2513 domain-containing protein [Paenibacillus alvei]EPY08221.1 hypothetical protein PAALTS15_05828 [Paenibacillus alvei TS-15]